MIEFEPLQFTPDSTKELSDRLTHAGGDTGIVMQELGEQIGAALPITMNGDAAEVAAGLSEQLGRPELAEHIIRGYEAHKASIISTIARSTTEAAIGILMESAEEMSKKTGTDEGKL